MLSRAFLTPGLSIALASRILDVMQNTFFRVDTLTETLLSLSHRQGKPGQDAKATAETARASTLVRMMFCELNYTRGLACTNRERQQRSPSACVG